MKKFSSLLKASMHGDMNIFRFKSKKEGISKIAFPIFLVVIVLFSVYSYADMIGTPLKGTGFEYVLLAMFSAFVVIMTFMEGMYKSVGILFDAKDNNLLFSMPIRKENIFFSRIIKLLTFEYMFLLLFIVPAYIKYILITKVSLYFIVLSLIFLIILPIIPTIISCIIGYFLKLFSSYSKRKNLAQIILSFVLVIGVMYASFNLNNLIGNLAQNASSINDLITKIYLPIGFYIDLIQKFDLIKFISLIATSIIPFVLFIYLFSFKYQSIINRSKETGVTVKKNHKKVEIKSNSKMKALVIKEFKNYFSSPVYIFNTIFGLIILVIASIACCFNLESTLSTITEGAEGLDINSIIKNMPILFMLVELFILGVAPITACSISLEGKKKDFIKSLPVSALKLLNSKILMSALLMIPFLLISNLIIIIRFKLFSVMTIYMILVSIIYPFLISILGIIINLKYPKFEFNSDAEVVKQSMSTMVTMLCGIVIPCISIFLFNYLTKVLSVELLIGLFCILYLIITFILYKILKVYGVKRFKEI